MRDGATATVRRAKVGWKGAEDGIINVLDADGPI